MPVGKTIKKPLMNLLSLRDSTINTKNKIHGKEKRTFILHDGFLDKDCGSTNSDNSGVFCHR